MNASVGSVPNHLVVYVQCQTGNPNYHFKNHIIFHPFHHKVWIFLCVTSVGGDSLSCNGFRRHWDYNPIAQKPNKLGFSSLPLFLNQLPRIKLCFSAGVVAGLIFNKKTLVMKKCYQRLKRSHCQMRPCSLSSNFFPLILVFNLYHIRTSLQIILVDINRRKIKIFRQPVSEIMG